MLHQSHSTYGLCTLWYPRSSDLTLGVNGQKATHARSQRSESDSQTVEWPDMLSALDKTRWNTNYGLRTVARVDLGIEENCLSKSGSSVLQIWGQT